MVANVETEKAKATVRSFAWLSLTATFNEADVVDGLDGSDGQKLKGGHPGTHTHPESVSGNTCQ